MQMELDRSCMEKPLGRGSYECKVDVLNMVTYLNRTLNFVCYVVGCGFKNGYQKDTCSRANELRAQSMIGGTCIITL